MSETGPPYFTPYPPSMFRVALLGASLLLAASACGTDEPPSVGQPTSTTASGTSTTDRSPTTNGGNGTATTTTTGAEPTTSATSSTATPANQEIVDAYTAYWDARFVANSGTPNPEDPALVAHASGAQLEAVIAETQRNLDDGVAFQASPVPANFRRVTVISVDGDRAEVQECFVDDVQVVDRTTGQIVNDVVATQSVSGTLRLVDGTWRVSGSDLVQRWEGVAGCALAS